MKITRRQLRGLIRETLLLERKTIASASDIQRLKPNIVDWVEVLLDELSTSSPRWNDVEVNEKRLKNMVTTVTDDVILSLIGVTSGMDYLAKRNQKKRAEEDSHQKWDKQRRAVRGSGVSHYGDYGSG